MKEQWKKLSKSEQWGIALTAAACIAELMKSILLLIGNASLFEILDGPTISLVLPICYGVFLLKGKIKSGLYVASLIILALQAFASQHGSELLMAMLLIALYFEPVLKKKWIACVIVPFLVMVVWTSVMCIFRYGDLSYLVYKILYMLDSVHLSVVMQCAAWGLFLPRVKALQKSKKKPVAPSCGDELYTLKQRLEQGAITQEEYDVKKQQILDAL